MSVRQLFEKYEISSSEEDFRAAKEAYENELTQRPDDIGLLFDYAYLNDHRAQCYEWIALDNYNKAIEKAKEIGEEKTARFYHINRQLILLESRIGEIHNSIDRCKKMLLADPENLNIFEMLIMAYKLAYQVDDALAAAEAGLKINPNSADMHQMLGEIYQMVGRYEEALESTEKSISIWPNGNTMRTRAILFQQLGRKSDFITAWETMADWYDRIGMNGWADKLREAPAYLTAKDQVKANRDQKQA